jgi:hypothetical protein
MIGSPPWPAPDWMKRDRVGVRQRRQGRTQCQAARLRYVRKTKARHLLSWGRGSVITVVRMPRRSREWRKLARRPPQRD